MAPVDSRTVPWLQSGEERRKENRITGQLGSPGPHQPSHNTATVTDILLTQVPGFCESWLLSGALGLPSAN